MPPELNPPPHTYAVRVGTAVLVFDDDKQLLLQKRKGANGGGTWSCAGGHLDFGETPEQCCVREVKEEMGIDVRDPEFLGYTNDVFEEKGRHYLTMWFRATHDAGEPAIGDPDEVEAVGWFPLDALPSPLFLPLKHLLEGKIRRSRDFPL